MEQEEVYVIIGPDTTLQSVSYFLLLINILWRIVYRWAVKEAETQAEGEAGFTQGAQWGT